MFIKNNKLFVFSTLGFFIFSFVESYRNTQLIGSENDLVFSYSTYIAVCVVLSLYCFIAVLVRYKSKYNKKDRLLKTIYVPIIFSMMFWGYYLGLNFESILTLNDSPGFFFIIPMWMHLMILPLIMTIYIFIIWKNISRKKLIGLLTGVYSLIWILMLSTLVSSFVSQFDIF